MIKDRDLRFAFRIPFAIEIDLKFHVFLLGSSHYETGLLLMIVSGAGTFDCPGIRTPSCKR